MANNKTDLYQVNAHFGLLISALHQLVFIKNLDVTSLRAVAGNIANVQIGWQFSIKAVEGTAAEVEKALTELKEANIIIDFKKAPDPVAEPA